MTEKMTMAEMGRLGGLVKAPRPADLLAGNPEAVTLARDTAAHNVPVVEEFYTADPDALILLAEEFLEVFGDKQCLYSDLRKTQKAAHQCYIKLRSIDWRKVDDGVQIFERFVHVVELMECALTMLEVWQDNGPQE